MPWARRRGRECAYTIVELVLVIVIIGILGSIAGPRFFDNTAFDERAYSDELAASLRYAQKVAVASGCHVRVDVAVGSYALTQQLALAGHCDTADATYPVTVLLSTGEAMSGSAPTGITTAPAIVIIYDPSGGTDLGANQNLTIGTHTLTVHAASGLVVAQ